MKKEHGLNWYYFGAHYYDPAIGRWLEHSGSPDLSGLSVDPLANDYPSWSPYNYVLDSPLNLIDKKGMSADSWDIGGDPYVYYSGIYANNKNGEDPPNLGYTETIEVTAERYKPSLANPLGWLFWWFTSERNYYKVLFNENTAKRVLPELIGGIALAGFGTIGKSRNIYRISRFAKPKIFKLLSRFGKVKKIVFKTHIFQKKHGLSLLGDKKTIIKTIKNILEKGVGNVIEDSPTFAGRKIILEVKTNKGILEIRTHLSNTGILQVNSAFIRK